MKIYTRTGDAGQTGLIDGSRVGKDDARVSAYGEVDELNAAIGVARAHLRAGAARDLLPPHPTLGDVDSPEALAGYQAAKRVHKAEWTRQRAAQAKATR